MSTSLTVLRSVDPRKLLTKRLYRNSDGRIAKQGYGKAFKFKCTQLVIANIFEFGAALTALREDSWSCVIRGEPLPGVDLAKPVLRRKHAKDDGPAYFRSKEAGQRWICLDFDKVQTPTGIDPVCDPEAAIRYVISLLPIEFHSATCWYQWSSSAGLDGWQTLRLHLWYMLDRAIPDAALKHWAKSSGAPVDLQLFDAVQVHYVADPILEDGIVDPVPIRSGFIEGCATTVSLKLPEKAHRVMNKPGTNISLHRSPGFDGWIKRIGDHPGGDGFHVPIRGAIACYVAINGAEATDWEKLKTAIRHTIQEADCSKHDPADLERYSSDAYLDDLIRGAIEKFGNRSRLIVGIEPHYKHTELTPKAAQAKISATLAAFTDRFRAF